MGIGMAQKYKSHPNHEHEGEYKVNFLNLCGGEKMQTAYGVHF
jgi:hypothetical protein